RGEAETASRMKSGLFHLLSHELRTPVAALVGFSSLLESALAPSLHSVETEHLNHIVAAAGRLNAIIGDVLLYSRTLAGPSRLDIVECRVAELIDDAATALMGKAQEKRILLAIAPALVDVRVACDTALIHRGLCKLID